MKKAALILGSCSDRMMYIFTHVMENPEHRLLADDQKYKNNITVLSILNSINSEHAKKVMVEK